MAMVGCVRVSVASTFAAAMAVALALPSTARAHSTTFAMYSKYEATTHGTDIAFVFALDKGAVLQLLEREVGPSTIDPRTIELYRSHFSKYLFARFSVRNDGADCSHTDELRRFFWDEATGRVLAVTRYQCASPLRELTIRSLVTHDLPLPHELVGDLQHGRALSRSFFAGDDVEARISLPSLPQSGERKGHAAARGRGKFSYVAMPDKERRYTALAASELGVDELGDAATDVHPWKTLIHFIGQGILHIFTGYDHILFILTLLLAVGSWRRLAIIVTSFTAAHSLTLIAATLGLVTLPARIVEPLIALSVFLVALDALVRPGASARALVTFGFGLIHGFGLSNVLRDLGLSGRELVPALLGFNAGVEIGQLLIVAPLFPLILWLRRGQTTYARARLLLCSSVAAISLVWIALRIGDSIRG
jgi:hydrogenase/urease accessory protein HupE